MRERKGRGEGRKEGADRKFKKQRNSISLKTSVHAAKRLVGAFPFLLKNPAWPVGVEGSMRSSIFHSDWSGTGWSAGDNRWSQLFRWPGKSSNRPGRRIARRTKNIFNGRKKKRKKEKEEKNEERERERENVTVITRSHHCDRVRSLQIFRNNATLPTPTTAPGDREFPLWRQFWPNICRTKWKSRSRLVTIDRFFISSSFYAHFLQLLYTQARNIFNTSEKYKTPTLHANY